MVTCLLKPMIMWGWCRVSGATRGGASLFATSEVVARGSGPKSSSRFT